MGQSWFKEEADKLVTISTEERARGKRLQKQHKEELLCSDSRLMTDTRDFFLKFFRRWPGVLLVWLEGTKGRSVWW